MPEPTCLIDTSAWIEYFRKAGDAETREAVAEALRSRRAAWCELIFLELMRGNARQREQAALIAKTFPCLPVDEACWQEAYRVAGRAAEAGKPVPNTDILIHACARRHGVTILHRDKHFDVLADLSRLG
ncbi:MAG: PIN domain-containing protein [Opitutales bacterium]|nr:PIN domain-containing protein [Opitutales bacterium]